MHKVHLAEVFQKDSQMLQTYLENGKDDGKLDFSTESLKVARRMSANKSAFSLIISVGIPVSWLF